MPPTRPPPATAELLPNQALLAAIVESSDDAIVSKGLDSVITSWNHSAERMFGHTPEQAIGQPVTLIIPPERISEETTILSRIIKGEKVEHFETERVTRDGRRVPVSLTISPIRGASGEVIGASKVARDISERKLAEAQKRMLTAELDHRVKNMLALVLSIAGQTRQSSGSIEEFYPAFEGRIMALAHAHSLLSQTRWSGSSVRDLAHRVVMPMCVDTSRCGLFGETILLDPNQAIGLAMVLHELATNAVKHGVLRGETGGVRIGWRRIGHTPPVRLELEWKEAGGHPIAPPTRRGYGSQLLAMVVEGELRGAVSTSFPPGGLECRLTLPLGQPAGRPYIGEAT